MNYFHNATEPMGMLKLILSQERDDGDETTDGKEMFQSAVPTLITVKTIKLWILVHRHRYFRLNE